MKRMTRLLALLALVCVAAASPRPAQSQVVTCLDVTCPNGERCCVIRGHAGCVPAASNCFSR